MARMREKVREEREKLEENQAREEAERRKLEEQTRRESALQEAREAVDGLEVLAGLACSEPRDMWRDEAGRFARLYAAFSRHWHEEGFPPKDSLQTRLSGCRLNMYEEWERRFGGAERISGEEFQEASLDVFRRVSRSIDESMEWIQELGRRGCAAPGRFSTDDAWALDSHYDILTHSGIGPAFMMPGSFLVGLTGCPRAMLDRILRDKTVQMRAQERGETVYLLGRELNAISVEVARAYAPQPSGESGPSRPEPAAGPRNGQEGESGGTERSSDGEPSSGGVGNGDGKSKKVGEAIKRDGKWPR